MMRVSPIVLARYASLCRVNCFGANDFRSETYSSGGDVSDSQTNATRLFRASKSACSIMTLAFEKLRKPPPSAFTRKISDVEFHGPSNQIDRESLAHSNSSGVRS